MKLGEKTTPRVSALEVSAFRWPAPPPGMIRALEVPPAVEPVGTPAAAQFAFRVPFVLFSHWMQGSTAVWPWKLVWLARNSSYSAGARNEVPLVARARSQEVICQSRPTLLVEF